MLVEPLRFLDRGAVDDAAARRLAERRARRSASLLATFTVRRTSNRRFGRAKPVIVISRIAHAELARDVGAHLGGRRRGEREDRRLAEPRDDGAEGEVVGTEVVSPLAHAVCLVDDEQAHRAREQPIEEVAVLEPLGREVEDLALALLDLARRLARLARGEMRVHGERVHAVRVQLVLLVLHQRDERADDDGEPGKQQRGELIDDATCRCPSA